MGKKRDIQKEKKMQTVAFLKAGNSSYSTIAKILGISKTSVAELAKKLSAGCDEAAVFGNNRNNCKGLRKTTDRVDRLIVRKALQVSTTTSESILKAVRDCGVVISNRTLRRRFYENGLKCRRPAKKPKLTQLMQKRRVLWAKLHRTYDATYWSKVIHIFLLYS